METSFLEMSRVALIVGSLFLITSVFFLTRGVRRVRNGASFFGKGGSSTFVLLGFGFFALGSLLFLLGVLRFGL